MKNDFTEWLLKGMGEMSIGKKQNEQKKRSTPVTTNQTARVVCPIKTTSSPAKVRIPLSQNYFLFVDCTKRQKKIIFYVFYSLKFFGNKFFQIVIDSFELFLTLNKFTNRPF